MNTAIERSLVSALSRSPAQPFFHWRMARRLVVLAYHEVVDASTFEWQIEYLRTEMHPVSLQEVTEALLSGRPLPARAVLITFDDGDRTVHDRALPILRRHGVPGVAFIVAGLLGTETPFWWREVEHLVSRGARHPALHGSPGACVAALKRLPDDQRRVAIEDLRRSVAGPAFRTPQLRPNELLALTAGGIAIGNHTFSHPCLDRCTPAAVETELVSAHERLTAIMGVAPTSFAYPNGNVDGPSAGVLRDLGYSTAFLFDHRIGAFPPEDPFAISRIRVSSTTDADRFRIRVSGLHSFVHRVIGRA